MIVIDISSASTELFLVLPFRSGKQKEQYEREDANADNDGKLLGLNARWHDDVYIPPKEGNNRTKSYTDEKKAPNPVSTVASKSPIKERDKRSKLLEFPDLFS